MNPEPRRPGVLGVHSLDHFAFTVPNFDAARSFYESFGLDVRSSDGALDLHAFGHPHRWVRVAKGERKALQHISFGAFGDDMDRFANHLTELGIPASERAGAARSLWIADPHGVRLEIRAAEKSSPNAKPVIAAPAAAPRGAPMRDAAAFVRPRRMSHALFFTPDLDATLDFYVRVLGLRLSDRSGPAAFLHGVHGSDHHLIAFAHSDGPPGYHHSAWDVGSFEEVGLGSAQMARAGHEAGWGVGRHVLGSNYFFYVRDPWGSFAEYSFDIDYVPADVDWASVEASPENSLSLWGPPPPADFVANPNAAPL